MINVEIGRNEQNQRLDKFLRKYLEKAPLSYIYKAIRKDVKVNGRRSREDYVLEFGDVVTLYMSDDVVEGYRKKEERTKVRRQFKIAYEDEYLIAVEKPFGLLTHGDRTEKKNHLANQVVDYLIESGAYQPRIEKTFTPAPVNRLDRNTTGLVLFGKTNLAVQQLNRMIREKNQISKYYVTIVSGVLKKELYLRDRMVKNHDKNKVAVLPIDGEGLEMETIVRPLQQVGKHTLVEVEIITGRTHQIRAHLAKAGYPIIGDAKYGNKRVNEMMKGKFHLTTQLLHAYKLQFQQCTGDFAYLNNLVITSELPEDFQRIKMDLFG